MKKVVVLGLAIAFWMTANHDTWAQPARPNIILIMADDMGYSDLGCYGGEIETPNLDALARNGLRFTNFYNAGRCCPTRASLLTGVYPHQAGIGGMISRSPSGEEGPYQGFLSRNTVTLAEVLREAGYYTAMSGKWHVGEVRPYWPLDRGFDDYFGLISGAANYFDIRKGKNEIKQNFARGNTPYLPPPENFYMTDAITDHAVETLENQRDQQQPFFLYIAYTAPHYPLHALPEDIMRYKGKFSRGWDELRHERYRRMVAMGIADESMPLTAKDPLIPSWREIENKEEFELKMEIYAAQLDRMDQGIGKVLEKLRDIGKLENTLILFLSDNGATAEGGLEGEDYRQNGLPPGGVESFQSYGRGWAHLSNTPFRYYKMWMHEGGIATPLIVSWPQVIKNPGAIVRYPGHIIDVMATAIDLAGARYPDSYNGNSIVPLEGITLAPLLRGDDRKAQEFLFWEHMGNKAVMKGRWKLVARKHEGDGQWALYDLSRDRAEENDLAADYPHVVKELHEAYVRWSEKTGARR